MAVTRAVLAGLLVLALATAAGAEEYALTMVDLRHRSAEDVIPLLRPLLAGRGAVSGQGGKLLLRVSPAQLEQVLVLVDALDTPPRRLLVTVGQLAGGDETQAAAALQGAVRLGRDGRIVFGGGVPPEGWRAGARTTTTRRDEHIVQRLQVLEGHEAYIEVGREISQIEGLTVSNGLSVEQHADIRYRPVTSGFYVRPRVSGDQVTVEVRPHRQQESPSGGGRIETQSLSTTVSGRLGEWLVLGTAEEGLAQRSGTVVRSTRELSRQTRQFVLKVEELP